MSEEVYDEAEELEKRIEKILQEATGKIREISKNLTAGRIMVDAETEAKKGKIILALNLKERKSKRKNRISKKGEKKNGKRNENPLDRKRDGD